MRRNPAAQPTQLDGVPSQEEHSSLHASHCLSDVAVGPAVSTVPVGQAGVTGAHIGSRDGQVHLIVRSSQCWQLWLPTDRWLHASRSGSSPLQETSSSQIGPEPSPYRDDDRISASKSPVQPMARQATCASSTPIQSSHTVPQPETPSTSYHTSTRPSVNDGPSTRRVEPPFCQNPSAQVRQSSTVGPSHVAHESEQSRHSRSRS
mmetsp:Transcript_81814/g.198262  ORF Transcript_81814/g.198262 Transcript_81814/m.198262 type:complete len:205 (+) Transcript_81814:3881-4495(+)